MKTDATDSLMNIGSLPDGIRNHMEGLDSSYFLFDLDKINFNIDQLRSLLNPNQIFFTIKSNSLPSVLETMAKRGCDFEANNVVEFDKAGKARASPAKIINSSPIAAASDVHEMWASGVRCFIYDSKNQVHNLKINAPDAKIVSFANQRGNGNFDAFIFVKARPTPI